MAIFGFGKISFQFRTVQLLPAKAAFSFRKSGQHFITPTRLYLYRLKETRILIRITKGTFMARGQNIA